MYSKKYDIPLVFEPTSVPKSTKLFDVDYSAVKYITPDSYEAKHLAKLFEDGPHIYDGMIELQGLEQETKSMYKLLDRIPNVIVKCGSRGCLVGTNHKHKQITHIKARKVDVVSVTGAGDTLVGVFVGGISDCYASNRVIDHDTLVTLAEKSVRAAELTVTSKFAVSPSLSKDLLL